MVVTMFWFAFDLNNSNAGLLDLGVEPRKYLIMGKFYGLPLCVNSCVDLQNIPTFLIIDYVMHVSLFLSLEAG